MKCEKCDNEFPVGKDKVSVWSDMVRRIIYFCSEECLKEFEKGHILDNLTRFDKGGEHEQES